MGKAKSLAKHLVNAKFVKTLVLAVAVLLPSPARTLATTDDSQCARVNIEIKQELTLERQAFDAHMRINNGLSHVTLEDVGVEVAFTDEEGNSVLASSDPDNTDALFFIRVDSMENIESVDGSGAVAPSSSADIHWLIIPAPGASNGVASGTLYYVGANLIYTIGGEENITEVTPDYIFVKPMPELTLDYFIPSDVYGDDAFTPEIEPPVPFSLGLRVKNNGFGVARDLKIDSAQPKIVENEQGLVVGFRIEGSEVDGQPATESLLVDLGDIEPNASKVARWIMTCTLSGRFVEFKASFSHSDELGGELTSLLQAANTHFLIRNVLVDLPGRDLIGDFLAKDGGVYRLYESDSGAVDREVLDLSTSAGLQTEGASGTETRYTLTAPQSAGFIYVRLPDPTAGAKDIKEVFRSDGKRIKAENAWISKSRNPDHTWQYFLNLFDADTNGSYTVVFDDPVPGAQAPVLQFIPDMIRIEEQQVSFIVEATDPDGTIPALSAKALPVGATFTDGQDGTGIFDWTPEEGQAGTYEIIFAASDGELKDTQRVVLTIYSIYDTDGDGMRDDWEMSHFGAQDRDGTGDFDGDGLTDLEEFLGGSDPIVSETVPSIPDPLSPLEQESVTDTSPDLVIANSEDREDDAVAYEFDIFSDPEMTELVVSQTDVPQGNEAITHSLLIRYADLDDPPLPDPQETTTWTIPQALEDNTRYYWRVRSTDGEGYSVWAYWSFFINTENDPPEPFNVNSPGDGLEVDTLNPVLAVSNAADRDNNLVTYAFEVYADEQMQTLVASVPEVEEGPDGSTSWTVSANPPLEDNTRYYWRAIATDQLGAERETPLSSLYTHTANHAPSAPSIVFPVPGSEVESGDLGLVANNSEDPDGDDLIYSFEIDTVNTFDGPEKMVSDPLQAGSYTTEWPVGGLEENTRYYWRAKAGDGGAESGWVTGDFMVNTINDNPLIPTLRNPGNDAWVETVTPKLSVNPTKDPDGDVLTYSFEVYRDAAMTEFVVQGESDTTEWIVTRELPNNIQYFWRAQAVDEHGIPGGFSETGNFFVKSEKVNEAPQVAVIEPSQDVLTNGDTLLIRWEDSDPDSNALIALYYDTDNLDQDGTLIVEGINEDPDGDDDAYNWDISTLEGAYYVYAVITDEDSSHTAYGPAMITIDHTPPTVTASPSGGSYTSTQMVVLESDETADIFYTTDGSDPTVESTPYSAPIGISEDTTLKFLARDLAGNLSNVMTETYTIEENIVVRVETDRDRFLTGIKVYAFTEAGSYTGKSVVTDESGNALFNPSDFEEGPFKFRVDYLGSHFWSDVVLFPDVSFIQVIIPEETATVTVSMATGLVPGVRVYLFSESGAYLGIYGITDENGEVTFDLPVGISFKFRADILGSQYWSETTVIQGGMTHPVSLDAGGGHFQVTLQEDPQHPMPGVRMYLFKESGTYLGEYQVSDADGLAAFDVSEGTYKVRADYLGYQIWTDPVPVTTDTHIDLTLPHQDVTLTLSGVFQESSEPIEGIKISLFTPAGAYQSQYRITDENGQVSFHLPEKAYKVRADYLGMPFWSEPFTWADTAIQVPMADALITVTGGGFPQEGETVYVYSASDAYLGLADMTDAEGRVTFRLAEGAYKFRVDHQGSQFWSEEATLTAHEVNPIDISVGGGAFTVTVRTDAPEPLAGVKCYVFDGEGTYIGLYGSTDAEGEVSFDLADGAYTFRVDYLGSQFWSNVITVPGTLSAEVVVEEEAVEVSVGMNGGPARGVRVYLFSGSGAYLGLYRETDAAGIVTFELPVGKDFSFRADILGSQYWSDPVTIEGGGTNFVAIAAGGGTFQVLIQKGPDDPMAGIKAYLFSEAGSYLGISQVTDESGIVAFDVPEGVYKVHTDYLGYHFWTDPVLVTEDTPVTLSIPHQSVEITASGVFQGTSTPITGVKVYLFTPTDAYQNQFLTTDENGKVVFSLPEKPYKVRVDFMGDRFWSDVFAWQNHSVNVPMADAEVTVTGAGLPREGIQVYAFTVGGAYLNLHQTTDGDGRVIFRLPAGIYKFRADYQANQSWSGEETLPADQVNPVIISVGGGAFAFTLQKGASESLAGVKCYVFNDQDAYIGLSGATNDDGEVSFDLSDGTYKIRADYLGYRFWTEVFQVPATLSEILTLDHEDVTVTVEGIYLSPEAIEGAKTYLFNPAGAYLGLNRVTGSDGRVVYSLPERDYRVRADYLGGQYWAEVLSRQDETLVIDEGLARIHVLRAGADVPGARVYLFDTNGAYLGRYEATDAEGEVAFVIPVGLYKFRADESGEQCWSDVVELQAGVESSVEVNLD